MIAYPFHHHITLGPSSNSTSIHILYIPLSYHGRTIIKSTSIHPHPKYHQIPPEYSYTIVLQLPILSTIISLSDHHLILSPFTHMRKYHQIPPEYIYTLVKCSPIHHHANLKSSSNSTSIHILSIPLLYYAQTIIKFYLHPPTSKNTIEYHQNIAIK